VDPRPRTFESYAFRVILLLSSGFCGWKALEGGGWHLWIAAPGLLVWALRGCDFDQAWEWWVYTLLCGLFAAWTLHLLLTLGPGASGSGRVQVSVFAGVGVAATGILISGRLRRVWSFAKAK
jgi:hypothetical protein